MSAIRVFRAASSWWMTAVLLALACGAYMYFSFGDAPFSRWRDFLFHRPPGIILYGALILNLTAATTRIVVKGLAEPVPSVAGIKEMDASEIFSSGILSLDGAAKFMRSWGFSPLSSGRGLTAVRGRYSFLPGTVFRSGMVLLLVSLLLSAHLRETGEALFGEGEEKQLLGVAVSVGQIEANLPKDYFRVGEEGSFILDKVSATASLAGGRHTVRSYFPSRAAGRYYRITHLGFVLPVSVRSGDAADAGDAYLDVLPPGKADTVSLGSSELNVSLLPERTISKGVLKGEQFNLTEPLYRITVKGHKDSPQGEVRLRPGESGSSGKTGVALGKSSPYVKIQAVRDPTLPWIYISISITAAGLGAMLSRFFWYRKEFFALEEGGSVYIGYREEFFRKWGVRRFHEGMKEFGGGDKA